VFLMPERRSYRAVVDEVIRLTPGMVRVVLAGADLEAFAVDDFTDSYVKCRFGDKTRSYTVRDWDRERRRLTLDFVVHGDRGIAGPWAAAAQPGDELEFAGPGGGYCPSAAADWHLMVGDESVLPAIAASLSRIPSTRPVFVVVEVDGPEYELPLASLGDLRLIWLHRSAGAGHEPELQLDAVKSLELPPGQGHAFVHGEATAVRLLRRHLVAERGLTPEALSASGYWKLRRTDEEWRAEKREWIRQADADLAA
jgi:NADPH-dependent ferric siderophore reductase